MDRDLLVNETRLGVETRFWSLPLKHQRVQALYFVVIVGVSETDPVFEPNVSSSWVAFGLLKKTFRFNFSDALVLLRERQKFCNFLMSS